MLNPDTIEMRRPANGIDMLKSIEELDPNLFHDWVMHKPECKW